MEQDGQQASSHLMVNRVEVLLQASCSACGGGFTSNPMGEKTLVLTLGGDGGPTFSFCGTCGDSIMGRVESEDARKRYVWDWAVPLRERAHHREAA
ncbi:MAG: hypothetical protein WA005_09620 [Candidatus Binataceae bacterium]